MRWLLLSLVCLAGCRPYPSSTPEVIVQPWQGRVAPLLPFDIVGLWEVTHVEPPAGEASVPWANGFPATVLWNLRRTGTCRWQDTNGLGTITLTPRTPQWLTWQSPQRTFNFCINEHHFGVLLMTCQGQHYLAVRREGGEGPRSSQPKGCSK
jgi:hypothetical protein